MLYSCENCGNMDQERILIWDRDIDMEWNMLFWDKVYICLCCGNVDEMCWM